MGIVELIAIEAEALTDDQRRAALHYIRSMRKEAVYETLPPEGRASIERGLEQLRNGETISFEEASIRLAKAARPPGT